VWGHAGGFLLIENLTMEFLLAQNSIDGGRVIYLVDTGKIQSLKFPTFWFGPTPQGKFMLSVAFGQAKYYTDNLIKSRFAFRQRRKKKFGFCFFKTRQTFQVCEPPNQPATPPSKLHAISNKDNKVQ
jgi:hypothetical protein